MLHVPRADSNYNPSNSAIPRIVISLSPTPMLFSANLLMVPSTSHLSHQWRRSNWWQLFRIRSSRFRSRDRHIRRLLTCSLSVGPYFQTISGRCGRQSTIRSLSKRSHTSQRHSVHQDCSLHSMGWPFPSNGSASRKGHTLYP